MKKVVNIALAGCKNTTYEFLRAMESSKIKIDLIISIPPDIANKNKVAGYFDLSKHTTIENYDFYSAKSYNLKNEEDIKYLSNYEIKVLLVIGWQRLIPEWLLSRLEIGAFGMHGSSKALPYGRGRSPMNWSLIQNKKIFITNLFKYTPGVDDGEIIATQVFDINEFDDARTLHYKNTLSMIKLVIDNIEKILNNNYNKKKQLNLTPTYYPKRTEDDGIIFWNLDTEEIYNLIRAVTKPFFGAFTFYEKNKITIWRAYPFDSRLFDPYIEPGTVLHVFYNGEFIVKTGNGSLIVVDYEIQNGILIKKDIILNSSNYNYKNPYIYPI